MIKKLMSEPEYRQYNAISYSELAGLDKHPANLISSIKPEGTGITFGSAVDTLKFDGEKVFKEKFSILKVGLPTDPVINILKDLYTIINQNNIFNEELNTDLNNYKKEIVEIARARKFGADNWKDDTLFNKIADNTGQAYFKFLFETGDKIVLDNLTYENVVNTVNILTNHPFTKNKFIATENTEIVFQFPIILKYKNKECKSLLYIFFIDHASKIIYPRDLKTLYDNPLYFQTGNYLSYRYYIQEAFYTDAVVYWKNNIQPEFKDYKIAPFEFIIVSSDKYKNPLIFVSTQDSYELGKYGGIINGRYRKGYKQLIEEKEWHLEKQLFEYPKEVYDNNGVMLLNINN